MIVFGFILYILLVAVLGISALVCLSPLLVGLFIIAVVNAASKTKQGKLASALWHVVTVGVILLTTGMLWKDIFDSAVDKSFWPFVLLLIYGLGSLIGVAIPKKNRSSAKQKPYRRTARREMPPEKTQKRVRINRIIAIVCLVLTVIGVIILATESAEISDALPPTIVAAIVAIICWINTQSVVCRRVASITDALLLCWQ